jgi:phenylalanyl-tRNA synthetase beta chain
MKFTLAWLKDHLETTASVEQIAATLSSIGLEVEGIENPAAKVAALAGKLAAFTVARVLEAKPHPNADKLRIARVEIAKDQPAVEVVCGAPNCRTGMIGVFAPLGAFIPGTGITLERKPVRGVVSNGMLLSEREMQLSDDHEGIVDLDEGLGASVGERYIDVASRFDIVIDVKLTPNRPDCTGVRGIARDLAAAGLGTLKPEPKLGAVEGTYDCPVAIRLEFPKGAESACPVFAGRYIRGVTNGASPQWLQARLRAAGLRPISALVDMTNYISLDRGRPLHVYDADKLEGAVRARLASNGEQFLALDGKTYVADETMCVIADESGPLGFGGIIGGESSGCRPEVRDEQGEVIDRGTRNVLVECAYFDPVRTAATGRKAGVQSDARYRFERGVDPGFVVPGLDLATDMLIKLVGGEPSRALIAGKPPIRKMVIAFDLRRVKRLAGLDIEEARSRKILEALGFAVAGQGPKVDVTVPSWRPDVQGPADLVEEVARIVGLENVPAAAMRRVHGVARMVLTERQRRARRARRVLAARGLTEAVTWSFIARAEASHFGGGQEALELDNPISSEMTSMRPSLLPGLLSAAQRNRNRGFRDVALFEVGQAYRGDRPEDQLLIAAGVRAGAAQLAGHGRSWDGNAAEAGVFDAKADVAGTLAALGLEAGKAQVTRDAPAWFHPGKSGTLRLGPRTVLAHFGELHPDTLRLLDVAAPTAAFEIYLDALPPEKRRGRARPAFVATDLLPVRRDFAFVLDEAVAAGDVVRAAQAADKGLIAGVAVFDVFHGGSLGKGKKSLGLEVTIQPRDRTLTDPEIEAIAAKVVAEVKRATGGEIRG